MQLVNKPSKTLGSMGGLSLKRYIDASLKKDESYFKLMGNLRNLLSGDHWDNVKNAKDRDQLKLVINLAHAHVRSLVPTLFFQNPTLDCYPTHVRHAGKEKIWNGLINNTWDKIGFKKEFKKAVLDSVVYPEAVIKHVVSRPADGGTTTEANSNGPTEWLTKGAPIHVRMNPKQLGVDYRVSDRDVEKSRYIFFRYRKALHELKSHPIYGKNIEGGNPATSQPSTGNLVGHTVESDRDDWEDVETKNKNQVANEEMVTIYEVWIHELIDSEGKFKCRQQMCVLMEGQDKPIRELTDWSEVMGDNVDRYPVTRIVLMPIPDDLPNSELGSWKGLQYTINWIVSRVTQLVENDRQIWAVDPSKIKNYERFRKQFNSGKQRTLAEVTETGAVELVQPTFVGRDNYQLLAIMQNFQKEVAGLGANRRGGSGIRTASEANIIEQGVQLKTDEKVDVVSDALKDCAVKSAQIIMSLVAADQGIEWVFRVGGDVGSVQWLNFTADDVNWMPDIRIRVNSFRKEDSLQDMQKFSGLIQIGLNLMQLGVPVKLDELYSRMLAASGVSDPSKIVGEYDQDVMLQMAEISAMMVGAQVHAQEHENHPAHMQAIQMFKQTAIYQALRNERPESADLIDQHEAHHNELLIEQQQKASSVQAAGVNPFMAATQSQGNPTPQSEANQATAESRNAVTPIPGGLGEFN